MPDGAPISPLLSNLYMRRFILGWKGLGYARRFKAEIVNYADDFVVLGRAPAAIMRTTIEMKTRLIAKAGEWCRQDDAGLWLGGH